MSSADRKYGLLWDRIYDLCSVLRGPHGCAWDRAQSSATLAPFFAEEVHEMLEALAVGSRESLVEEIGDTLYLWTFLLQALVDEEKLLLEEAIDGVERKLMRRHPHVFGERDASTGAEALGHWERQKRQERNEREVLRRLPARLSALAKARRVQERAAAYGFDWSSGPEVLDKIREEIAELSAVMVAGSDPIRTREELGDLLFSVVNLARHLDQDPEAALVTATEKFRIRFNRMVRSVELEGHTMGETSVEILESHWQKIKHETMAENPPSGPE